MQQPTADQVKEINDTIDQAVSLEKIAHEEADKGHFHRAERLIRRAGRLKQKAIKLADRYYGIGREPASGHLHGEPTYDPNSSDEGDTRPTGGGEGRVTIGPGAFVFNGKASAAWLASTKAHEILGHIPQIQGDDWSPGNNDEQELEAYQQEYDNRGTTGLTDDQVQEIRKRMQRHYRRLPPALKGRWRRSHPFVTKCAAFIYRNRETGKMLYCTNDSGDSTSDYVKIGAGDFPCGQTGYCSIR
jgi:hypothetical protein